MVSSFDDVHFLVVTASVSFLPSSHINILLFVLFLFLLFCAIDVNVISIFYLRLLGKVDRGVRFGFVFQAAQLLIGEMVEFNAASILSLTVQQLSQCLFDLIGLHRHGGVQFFTFELTEIILSSVEYLVKGDELIAKEYFK